jgi:proline iminopeptidase
MRPRFCSKLLLTISVLTAVWPVALSHGRAAGVRLIAGSDIARPFDDDYNQAINGVTLHFRVRGVDKSNPYLLILHGGPGAGSFAFYPWGESIETKLNVVYLDQRGCGGSTRLKFADPEAPRPEEVADYTMENLIKDAEGVRTFLKVDKWFVLGHSFGGMLALEYVVANQDHVLGYIYMNGLFSTPMFNDNVLDRSEAFYRKQATAGDAAAKAAAEKQLQTIQKIRAMPTGLDRSLQTQEVRGSIPGFTGGHLMALKAYNDRVVEAGRKYKVSPASQNAFEAVLAMLHNEHNHFVTRDDRPLLARVHVPTLVIDGKDDGLIPPSLAEIVHSGIKGSEFVLLDDCGHAPYAEQPEKTSEAVLEFVRKSSPKH